MSILRKNKFIWAAKLSLITALGFTSVAMAEVNFPQIQQADPNVTIQQTS